MYIHVVFLFVVVLYKPLCRTALSILNEGTSSNSPIESVNYMYPVACMCTAGLSNRDCPVVCLSTKNIKKPTKSMIHNFRCMYLYVHITGKKGHILWTVYEKRVSGLSIPSF